MNLTNKFNSREPLRPAPWFRVPVFFNGGENADYGEIKKIGNAQNRVQPRVLGFDP